MGAGGHRGGYDAPPPLGPRFVDPPRLPDVRALLKSRLAPRFAVVVTILPGLVAGREVAADRFVPFEDGEDGTRSRSAAVPSLFTAVPLPTFWLPYQDCDGSQPRDDAGRGSIGT